MDYPYKNITPEEALEDYNKLRETNASEITFSTIGNKACDYLFEKHRVKTSYANRLSKYDAWKVNKKKILENAQLFVNRTVARKNKNVSPADIRGALSLMYGSVNQFRPMVAKYIYKRFKPKRVLDISAGWGNRLLAAMACDIDYIGIDSNKNLKSAYEKMYQMYPTKSNIQIIINNSENVDFSKLPEYDMIFTSPPYYTIEMYQNMKQYESKEDFVNTFFKPVVMNSYKNLKKGGYLILNMPVDMKDEMVKFKIAKRINAIKMPIQNRFSDGTKRFEYIYWFQKLQ